MIDRKVFTQRTIDQINKFVNEKLFCNLYPGGFSLSNEPRFFDHLEEQVRNGETEFDFDIEFYESYEDEALLAHFYEGCVFYTDENEVLSTSISMYYDKDFNNLEVVANFIVSTCQWCVRSPNAGELPVVILDGKMINIEDYYKMKFGRSYEEDIMSYMYEDQIEATHEEIENNFKKATDCDFTSRAVSTVIQLED